MGGTLAADISSGKIVPLRFPQILSILPAIALFAVLYSALRRPTAAAGARQPTAATPPLRVAIFNQVHFHTHVVAGSLHVLRAMTSAPVTVYLPKEVLQGNWYGFMDWLGKRTDVDWRLCDDLKNRTDEHYDIMWFISPEWDVKLTEEVVQTHRPKMVLLYIHNGHMPQDDFNRLRALSPNLPLLTMGPHVAKYVQQRVDADPARTGASKAEWMIPTYKYEADKPCSLAQQKDSFKCLDGFSITGSLDKSLRNYTSMWEQISVYQKHQGSEALQNFILNILGEVVQDFFMPDELQQYVTLYKTPPDPVFYEVISHSYALVPALANPQYYTSKLTSSAITSLMTGVPVIADSRFLDAYSMMEPAAVFRQESAESELDAMFRIAKMDTAAIQATRAAVEQLRRKMNARASGLVLGWLLNMGLVPDKHSTVAGII